MHDRGDAPGQVVHEFVCMPQMYVQVGEPRHQVTAVTLDAGQIGRQGSGGSVTDRPDHAVADDDGLVFEDTLLVHRDDIDANNGEACVCIVVLSLDQSAEREHERQKHEHGSGVKQ